ncbi:bifunctional phosphopantothenoylcysteine decarboxylase/phosphopantothenate--cysteine ligase CoaBC [Spongisporangium articulatum]|uniref:Coenzyme A biosynthesis bifunctional protein CoaBC n=1 Tax=Spongisporangium articulatum TaxID=3362603 RepID=A0ABW8ARA0_9ACTN
MNVVLGVGGGIAAYKAALLLRLFTEAGHDVHVVPTDSALRFVGAPTWEALSGHPVSTTVWDDVPRVPHVLLGKHADLVVVAPATADLLARAAAGLASDLLGNVLLTATCPVLLAPAMHTEMWQNLATVANVATLRARGLHVLDPASGRLTGTDTGPGRLPEPEEIYAAALDLVAPVVASEPSTAQDLAGRRVLVTAGGTREPLDPVRYLGNRSSGRQGVALAEAAAARGARVTLVAGAVEVPLPESVTVVRVESALQMRDAVLAAAPEHDVVVMAAAVADFRPAAVADHKIKKTEGSDEAPVVRLVRNPDILVEVVENRGAGRAPAGQVVVGFAAETGDADSSVLDHARAKLARKGCDLLVVNDVSAGKVFGRDDTEVVLLRADRADRADSVGVAVPAGSKTKVAEAIWDEVVALIHELST